jgi:hypothetical protein
VLREDARPEITVYTPAASAEEGTDHYQIQWEAAIPDNSDARVSLYYGLSMQSPRRLITHGLHLTQTSYLWDTSAVPTGEYVIYAEVNNGVALQHGAYSVGSVAVENNDAPPAPTPTDMVLDLVNDTALVTWSAPAAPDLEGYRVYYGRASGAYVGFIEVTDSTQAELLAAPPSQSLHVAITAYDSSGNESGFSEEITGRPSSYQNFLPMIMRLSYNAVHEPEACN